MTLIVLVTGLAGSAQAYRPSPKKGKLFFSGEGNLYYGKATRMLMGLGAIAVKFVIVPALLAEEEEEEYWDPCGCDFCCDADCEDLDVPVEAYQFGGSMGYFVTSGIALGWRLVIQENDHRDRVSTFWGGGPELSYYGGSPYNPVRPFLSVGALYANGRLDGQSGERITMGPAFHLRTGFSVMGPEGAVHLQTSFQSAPVSPVRGFAHTESRWGIGLGFAVFID